MRLKALLEQRAKAHEQMQGILAASEAEQRRMTAEEAQSFDRAEADITAITEEIRRAERLEKVTAELDKGTEVRAGRADTGRPSVDDDAYAAAWRSWARHGLEGMEIEERKVLMAGRVTGVETRAQSSVTGNLGQYTVPRAFANALEVYLRDYSGVLAGCDIVATETGAQLDWPGVDDTSQTGEQLGENSQAATQDVTFSTVTLDAYTYSSKVVLVPLALIQDTAFNMDALLVELLGTRIGRILNTRLTLGTGSSQPNGIVTATTFTAAATGNATSMSYDELLNLIHSVDPAYRKAPGVGFMLNDNNLKVVRQLKDSQNRPLWQPGMAVGEPDTIFGYKYFINQDMANFAANAKGILFGDLKAYKVRQVKGVTMMRLTERYADYLQVGFLGFARYDGDLVNTAAIKGRTNSAT
jgi:HK97 family phage major capsid protein